MTDEDVERIALEVYRGDGWRYSDTTYDWVQLVLEALKSLGYREIV